MSAFDGNGTVSYRRCWEWDHQSVLTSSESAITSKKPPVAAADQHHRSAGHGSSSSSALYAVIGPTLLDIESALAACTPTPQYVDSSAALTTACCSSSPSLRQPHDLVINGANVRQDLVTSVESSTSFVNIDRVAAKSPQITAHREEIQAKELPSDAGAAESKKSAVQLGMSRFKRTATEQRYTMRIRSEVDTVEDGYRWRKYGQKLIKASSHPRSYYRCTDVRCHVKKQVERSSVEAGMVEVTYEGIHLHYQPFPLAITRSDKRPPTSQQSQ